MAKVKLPPLPGVEPEGSMAVYLAQVQQKREPENTSSSALNPSENIDLTTTSDNSDSANTNESSLQLEKSVEISQPGNSIVNTALPAEGTNKSTLTNDRSPSSVDENADLSKILDKKVQLKKDDASKSTEEITIAKTKTSIYVGGQPKRNSTKSESSTKSNLEILKYINSMPKVFMHSFYAKGEMKIRVTNETAALLRILVECSHQIEQPKYLAENLVNQLLEDFFYKYASDIEQLSIEQQQQRVLLHQNTLSVLKQKVNS